MLVSGAGLLAAAAVLVAAVGWYGWYLPNRNLSDLAWAQKARGPSIIAD